MFRALSLNNKQPNNFIEIKKKYLLYLKEKQFRKKNKKKTKR